ncbi:MAG: hypothetical protein AB7E08_04690 [Candidatus Omnitrophota bacterium]
MKKKEEGVSLLAVILTIIFFSIIGFVALSMLSTGTQRSVDYHNSEKAFYIAESGVEVAFRLIKDHWDWQNNTWQTGFNFSDYAEGNIGEGTFSLTVSPLTGYSDRLNVTSTGNYKNAYRTINTIALKKGALDFAIYTNNNVSVTGNATVTGDIMETSPDKTIYFQKPEAHSGDKYYDDHGTIPALAPPPACTHTPSCANYYMCLAKEDGQYYQPANTEQFNNQPLNGVIYVEGDAKITGTCETTNPPAVLVVIGDLDIAGTIDFKGLIYVSGNVTKDELSAGDANIEGEIISANSIDAKGNFNITYNEDYAKRAKRLNGTPIDNSIYIIDNYSTVLSKQFREIKTPFP